MYSLPPISARGLDIEGVTHIINLDVPRSPRIISIVQAAAAERAWKALPSPLSPL